MSLLNPEVENLGELCGSLCLCVKLSLSSGKHQTGEGFSPRRQAPQSSQKIFYRQDFLLFRKPICKPL
jgi:hypothetical protein